MENKSDDTDEVIKFSHGPKSIVSTILNITQLAFPIIFYYWCIFLQQSIIYYFIGQKYPLEEKILINSMGITNIYMNTVVLSISLGLLSGIDILCSNAFGAKNYYLLGVYWHRGRLITFIFTIFFCLINFFLGTWLLSFIISQPEILINVDRYLKTYVFSLFAEVLFATNFKYLNVIGHSRVPLLIVLFTIFVHVFNSWLLIEKLNLGIVGGAIAIGITNFSNFLISYVYIHMINPCPESNFPMNLDCFKEWKVYLKFTIPSLLLNCFPWWAFEIQSIIVYFSSLTDYNAHVIGVSIYQMLVSISSGFGVSMTILVGKTIVNSTTRATKKLIIIIIIYGNIISFLVCLLYYLFDIKIFELIVDPTVEPEVIKKAQLLVKAFIFIQFIDFQQSQLSSLLKSLNRQKIASIIAFIGFYVVQNSVSIYLALYLNYGVIGSWIGIGSGSFFALVSFSIICFNIDLRKMKLEIISRMEKDNNNLILKLE